jgi:hypothetical protein
MDREGRKDREGSDWLYDAPLITSGPWRPSRSLCKYLAAGVVILFMLALLFSGNSGSKLPEGVAELSLDGAPFIMVATSAETYNERTTYLAAHDGANMMRLEMEGKVFPVSCGTQATILDQPILAPAKVAIRNGKHAGKVVYVDSVFLKR